MVSLMKVSCMSQMDTFSSKVEKERMNVTNERTCDQGNKWLWYIN